MSSIARIFGAPVIEPPGKVAASRSKASRPGARRPVTVDTRCCTDGVRSSRQSRGTRTLPGRQTRPRSLRRTSTIIVFSARSFSEAEQLGGEGPILGAGGAARAGSLDRVGPDATGCVEGQERLRRGRDDGAARPGPGTARRVCPSEVEVGGERRRLARPQAAEDGPRIAVEAGDQPAGEVRLVELARRRSPRGPPRRAPVQAARSISERKTRRGKAGSPRRGTRTAVSARARTPASARCEAEPRRRRPPGRSARPARRARPTRSPRRGARGAGPAGPGRRPPAPGGAPGGARGRMRGGRRGPPANGGAPAGQRRRVEPREGGARLRERVRTRCATRPAPRPGPRRGTTSAPPAPAARSRAGPAPAGRGTRRRRRRARPRRAPGDARRRSWRVASARPWAGLSAAGGRSPAAATPGGSGPRSE